MEKTAFKEGGVLEIRRSHNMINRWNKALAVGLRKNHDISFLGTQTMTMAVMLYVTNYATKLAGSRIETCGSSRRAIRGFKRLGNRNQIGEQGTGNQIGEQNMAVPGEGGEQEFHRTGFVTSRGCRPSVGFWYGVHSQQGLDVSKCFSPSWEIFGRWLHLRYSAGEDSAYEVDETVMREQSGQRATYIQAYPRRGPNLAALSLYDYMSVVKLKRKHGESGGQRA